MGKATSTRQLTRNKKKKQRNTDKWLGGGEPRKKAGCANAQSIHHPPPPAYPPLQRTGPLPRIDLFPLLRRPVVADGRYGWGFPSYSSFEDGWVH